MLNKFKKNNIKYYIRKESGFIIFIFFFSNSLFSFIYFKLFLIIFLPFFLYAYA